ncbi:diacylglycerol/lipid kinase family protein [Marinicella sp. W31]|uniref:diacylglycerol/lipid kinase family protein n=1 Tax=Marinicella sp. W31 TaxID=3023713 RepID=UPI003756A700
MHLLILWNATAGGHRASKYQQLVQQALNQQNIHYEMRITEYAGHARRLVTDTHLNAFDAVVAAGGDGTVFEVLNGLMQHPAEQRKPLGILPLGTGNAFIKDIGLKPFDWQTSLQNIIKAESRRIDVAEVCCSEGSFYFLNIIGLGFVVDVGQSASKLKYLGKSAYTLATLWQTLKLKTHPIRLTLDGIEQDEKLVFLEVANSRYTGSSFLIAPDASIDDGLLDLVMLKHISRPRLLKLFPSIYDGSHIHYPEIVTRQAKNITIETQHPMKLMPDGEFLGETPIKIRCLPGEIKLLAPTQ